jgi:hypothetical protein
MGAYQVPTYSPRFWTGANGLTPAILVPTIPILKAFDDARRAKAGVAAHGVMLKLTLGNGGMAGVDIPHQPVCKLLTARAVYEQWSVRRSWMMRADHLQIANMGTAPFLGLPYYDLQVTTIAPGGGDCTIVVMHDFIDPLGDGEVSLGSIVEMGLQGDITAGIPAGLTLTGWELVAFTLERSRPVNRDYLDTFRVPFVRNQTLNPDVLGGGMYETVALCDGAGLNALTLAYLRRGSETVAENTILGFHSMFLDGCYDMEVSLQALLLATPGPGRPTNAPLWLLRESKTTLGTTPAGQISYELSAGTGWPAGTNAVGIMRLQPDAVEIANHEAACARLGQSSVIGGLNGKRPLSTTPAHVLQYAGRRSSPAPAKAAAKLAAAQAGRASGIAARTPGGKPPLGLGAARVRT